jgi:chemotaxis signal transduction protein
MTTTATGDDVQLVTFRVAGQDFAFNIFQVERILHYERRRHCPRRPSSWWACCSTRAARWR